MNVLKRILLGIGTVLSVLSIVLGTGPKPIGGCFDTTKDFGWPFPAYTTQGVQTICSSGGIKNIQGGMVAARWHYDSLIIDIIVFATIICWVYIVFKKIKKKEY